MIEINAKLDRNLQWAIQRVSDGLWWDADQQVWIILGEEVD